MFTAALTGEVVDLRLVPRSETTKLHVDRKVPWACRGCGGRVHVRLHRGDADEIAMWTFAHNPGEAERCRELGYHTDESPQHHALKARLATAAQKRGWSVDLEVPGERCRADVVVSKKNQTRVLEAQLSPLSVEDAVDRTDRYTRSFGQTTWTHTGFRPWSKKVEAVQVDDELGQVIGGIYRDEAGSIKHDPVDITTAVGDILAGRLRYIHFQAAEGTVGYFIPIDAPKGRRRPPRQQNGPARGAWVRECDRPIAHGIRCVNCGHYGPAGSPCANDECAPPACPGCGRRPWHRYAKCPSCGHSSASSQMGTA